MKRRSRGEQMLAAAGLAPASTLKSAQHLSPDKNPSEETSPPAKRARKATLPAQSSQRGPMEPRSPPKPMVDKIKLSAELELLASMFDALRTGRMMLKRRSEKVTYNSVRHVIENLTKREFRVEHLAQMKYLRPESFDWQYIRTPSASNPQQLELQLLLTFDRPAFSCQEGGGGDGSVGKYNSSSEQADFRAALEQYVRDNPPDPETGSVPPVPQAQLPPRPAFSSAAPSRSGSLPQSSLPSPAKSAGTAGLGAASGGLVRAATCPPGLLDSQAGALPSGLQSPSGSALSGASPALTRSRSRLGIPPGAPPPSLTPIPEDSTHTPSKRPAGAAGAQLRLAVDPKPAEGEVVTLESEDPEGESAGAAGAGNSGVVDPAQQRQQQQGDAVTVKTAAGVGGGSSSSDGAAATPQSKGPRPAALQVTPNSHRLQPAAGEGDPRLARLHSMLSPAALQRIMQAEAAQAAQTPEAKRRAEMRRAVQLLPHGHDLVRLIFGIQGPTVKPVSQVAQAMCERSTQRQGLNSRDANNTLVAMARAAPEFLRIEEPRVMADGSARPRSVVISRAANINTVAAKLKALAADPDAGVQVIFDRGGGAGAGAAEAPGTTGTGQAAPSPSRSGTSVQQATGAVVAGPVPPESPSAQLRPRALAAALEGEGGQGTSGAAAALPALPPPPPSARKRPPGLPLAPMSPMPRLAAQTPTRSQALRGALVAAAGGGGGGGALEPLGPAQENVPPVAVAAPQQQQQAEAAEFLQKISRASAPSSVAGDAATVGGGVGGDAAAAGSGQGAGQRLRGEGENGDVAEAPGRTPARGAKTPGRTAVQEAMLNSIRRSSAKRSCRRMADQEGEGAVAGVGEVEMEDAPQPKRLEDLLG